MYKLVFVFYLLCFISFKSNALDLIKKTTIKPIHQTLKIDSSNFSLRNFNTGALNQYRKDSNFNYHTDETQTGLSWWSRFWTWIWHIIENLFGNASQSGSGSSPFIKYSLLALAVGLLIYVVIKLIGVDNIFNRASKQIEIHYTESLENIHEITFDEEIEKAMAQRNYKLAVRLLYLRSLKHLNDAQLIHWQIEKTNSAYLNELTDSGQRQSFSVLTRQFEYVWYGDFPVDGRSFHNINVLFQDFKKTLP